jgi:hypothetical protein
MSGISVPLSSRQHHSETQQENKLDCSVLDPETYNPGMHINHNCLTTAVSLKLMISCACSGTLV